MNLIESALQHCKPVGIHWLPGLVNFLFGAEVVKKFFQTNMGHQHSPVVFFDDEAFDETIPATVVEELAGRLVIAQNMHRHQQFLDLELASVHWPYVHWFLSLIPLSRLPRPRQRYDQSKTFNFLNRKWNSGRLHAIEHIIKHHGMIIDHGYISANMFSYYNNFQGFNLDKDFLEFYNSHGVPYEAIAADLQGVPVSVNVQNYFYIAERIPGHVSLQIDSFDIGDKHRVVMSEKPLMPVITEQIPMIVGVNPGTIAHLRNIGVDVFDDIIDHSYDLKPEYYNRIETCLDDNINVLMNSTLSSSLQKRFFNNYNFIRYEFLPTETRKLYNLIESNIK